MAKPKHATYPQDFRGTKIDSDFKFYATRISLVAVLVVSSVTTIFEATPGANIRVTVDQNGTYESADQLAGGTYTDGVLQRCGIDRRVQNEPTLAIDPRNATVWASGANDYCTVPTAGDVGGFLPKH